MRVTAKTDKVAALVERAVAYQTFLTERQRRLSAEQSGSIARLTASLNDSTADTIEAEQTDLTNVRVLSREHARTFCSPLRKAFQTHCLASYLSFATAWVILGLPALIAAPIVFPVYFCLMMPISALFTWLQGGHLFGSDYILFRIGINLILRYCLFLLPSYVIARDLRQREFTVVAYLIAVILFFSVSVLFL